MLDMTERIVRKLLCRLAHLLNVHLYIFVIIIWGDIHMEWQLLLAANAIVCD